MLESYSPSIESNAVRSHQNLILLRTARDLRFAEGTTDLKRLRLVVRAREGIERDFALDGDLG